MIRARFTMDSDVLKKLEKSQERMRVAIKRYINSLRAEILAESHLIEQGLLIESSEHRMKKHWISLIDD